MEELRLCLNDPANRISEGILRLVALCAASLAPLFGPSLALAQTQHGPAPEDQRLILPFERPVDAPEARSDDAPEAYLNPP